MDKHQFISELDAIEQALEETRQRIYSLRKQADHFYDAPAPLGEIVDEGEDGKKLADILRQRKKNFYKINSVKQ